MERTIYLNRYRVVAGALGVPVELRRDGSAVTYKAEDVRSGDEVTVEVIPAFELSPVEREELEREAFVAKEVEHINIPILRAFGVEADHLVYAWEYFHGTSAEAWVKAHGRMPVGSVLRIALQIASALEAAALHEVVHGAINPRNVMLVPGQTPQGEWPLVKLLNLFGTAPEFSSAHVGADFGSKFASAEQLQTGLVDFGSEMYSLGATLWFLLTGAAPETHGRFAQVAGIPKPVARLIEQMVSRNADERPRDPSAFREQIRLCLDQVERREAISGKPAMPMPAAVPLISAEPRNGLRWRPLALAAALVASATLAALFLPASVRPSWLFAGLGQGRQIGVPIGMPEPDSVQTEEPAQISSESSSIQTLVSSTALPTSNASDETTAEQAQIAATTTHPREPAPAPANPAGIKDVQVLEEELLAAIAPPTLPVSPNVETSAAEDKAAVTGEEGAPPPQLVAINEDTAAAEDEPVPPSEGPEESASPPQDTGEGNGDVAETEKRTQAPVSASEPEQNAPARILPRMERPIETAPTAPVARPKKNSKRPKRIDGREVRVAEPVEGAVPIPEQSPPSRRSSRSRARFLGTAPDGSLIFETPSPERGFDAPRR